jgi:hypothetical protein
MKMEQLACGSGFLIFPQSDNNLCTDLFKALRKRGLICQNPGCLSYHRAHRTEHWMFTLFYFIIWFVLAILAAIPGAVINETFRFDRFGNSWDFYLCDNGSRVGCLGQKAS